MSNPVSCCGTVVCVIVAVQDELYADGSLTFLRKAGNVAPNDIRRVDEHGRVGQRVGITVFLVNHFQLAVVFVNGCEFRHLDAQHLNETFQ